MNRFVNVVAHEVAHGFGVMTSKAYLVHGLGPATAGMNWIHYNASLGAYLEDRDVPLPVTGQHEPLDPPFGFTSSSTQANTWLMTAAIFRWRNNTIVVPDAYDSGLVHWLIFDRPLSFSRTADYAGRLDLSLEQFFRERVPACITGSPLCR